MTTRAKDNKSLRLKLQKRRSSRKCFSEKLRKTATPRQRDLIGSYALEEAMFKNQSHNGIIRRAINTATGSTVIVKELPKTSVPTPRNYAKKESTIAGKLQNKRHSNVINFMANYEGDDKYFLVMEFAKEGDLIKKVADPNYIITEEKAKLYFAQMLLGVGHLHAQGLVHRDLKPDNIFFASEDEIRIGDFGFSSDYKTNESERTQQVYAACGTLHYNAPELFLEIPVVGPELDIWSLGIILYGMITKIYPFWGETNQESIYSICFDNLDTDSLAGYNVSPEFIDIIKVMLTKNPTKRATIQELKQHPWVKDEIQRQLNLQRNNYLIGLKRIFKAEVDLLSAKEKASLAKTM